MADKKISALTGATTPLAGSEVLPIVQGGSTVKVSVDNLTTGKAVTVKSLGAVTGLSGATQATDITISRTSSTGAVLTGPNIYFDEGTANNTIAIQNGAGYFQVFGYNGSFIELLKFNNTGNITAPIGNFVVGTAGKGIDFSANTHAAGMTSELLDDYETGTWTPAFLTSGGLSLPQTSTGTYTKIGNTVHFWFSCTFDAGASPPRTDVYYTTDFPFQGTPTFQNVGCASVSGGSAQFPVEAITASRLRTYLTASVTTFTGFGTLRV